MRNEKRMFDVLLKCSSHIGEQVFTLSPALRESWSDNKKEVLTVCWEMYILKNCVFMEKLDIRGNKLHTVIIVRFQTTSRDSRKSLHSERQSSSDVPQGRFLSLSDTARQSFSLCYVFGQSWPNLSPGSSTILNRQIWEWYRSTHPTAVKRANKCI